VRSAGPRDLGEVLAGGREAASREAARGRSSPRSDWWPGSGWPFTLLTAPSAQAQGGGRAEPTASRLLGGEAVLRDRLPGADGLKGKRRVRGGAPGTCSPEVSGEGGAKRGAYLLRLLKGNQGAPKPAGVAPWRCSSGIPRGEAASRREAAPGGVANLGAGPPPGGRGRYRVLAPPPYLPEDRYAAFPGCGQVPVRMAAGGGAQGGRGRSRRTVSYGPSPAWRREVADARRLGELLLSRWAGPENRCPFGYGTFFSARTPARCGEWGHRSWRRPAGPSSGLPAVPPPGGQGEEVRPWRPSPSTPSLLCASWGSMRYSGQVCPWGFLYHPMLGTPAKGSWGTYQSWRPEGSKGIRHNGGMDTLEWMKANLPAFLKDLEALVRRESPSGDPPGPEGGGGLFGGGLWAPYGPAFPQGHPKRPRPPPKAGRRREACPHPHPLRHRPPQGELPRGLPPGAGEGHRPGGLRHEGEHHRPPLRPAPRRGHGKEAPRPGDPSSPPTRRWAPRKAALSLRPPPKRPGRP
jgi:hypothetical protein